MKERQGMSFKQMKDELNATRIEDGKTPGFSVCGITSRVV